jgi:Flp pilus assembly protein TadG
MRLGHRDGARRFQSVFAVFRMSRLLHTRSRLASESGQSAVEFALVFPFVLVILLGFVDMGFVFNFWNDEQHLASSGARYATVNRVPGTGTLQDYVKAQADSSTLRDGGTSQIPDALEVCVEFPGGRLAGQPVKVTVRTTYRFFPGLGISDVDLTGSATMRLEAVPDATRIPSGCA